MLFNFELRPINEITPWGSVSNPDARTPEHLRHPPIGWFQLTDGWYWIDTGQGELFRYSQALTNITNEKYDEHRRMLSPYVDYYVMRLWEDLLDMLPWVLGPIPANLAHAISRDGAWGDWQRQVEATLSPSPNDEGVDLYYDASRWSGQRRLDSGYLMSGPYIYFWNDGADIHIQWDNRDRDLEGAPAWDAILGQVTMPVAAFLGEARVFNDRFIRRMADRVAIAQGEWSRPDVMLDPGVGREQVERSHYLQRCLEAGTAREPDDWDRVFSAIARIEALREFPQEASLRLN
jgi:Family of unknown function (DUF5984)